MERVVNFLIKSTCIPLLLAFCLPTEAQVYINSIANGSWHDASTWDCNCVPGGALHIVIIHHVVTHSAGTTDIGLFHITNDQSTDASLTVSGGTITTTPGLGTAPGCGINSFANGFTSDLIISGNAIVNVGFSDGFTVSSSQTGDLSSRIIVQDAAILNVDRNFYYFYSANDGVPETQTEISITDAATFTANTFSIIYSSSSKNSQLQLVVDEGASLIGISWGPFGNPGISLQNQGGDAGSILFQVGPTAGSAAVVNIDNISLADSQPVTPAGDRVIMEVHESSSVNVSIDLYCYSAAVTPGNGYIQLRSYDASHVTVGRDIYFDCASGGSYDNLIEVNDNSILEMRGNTINPDQGTYIYNNNSSAWFTGAIQQTIPSADPFYVNMRLNNTSGQNFLLYDDTFVSGDLNFIRGIVNSNANVFFMLDNATVSGANDLSFVDGPVYKLGDDAFTFPVGDNGYYRPASISALGGIDEIWVQYINEQIFSNADRDAGLTTVSECEYWLISADFSNVDITLSWNSDQCTEYNITDINHIRVVEWDQNTDLWTSRGNGGATGDGTAGIVTSEDPIFLGALGFFTLGSVSPLTVLPIELLEFNATPYNNAALLKWSTASELNNSHFIIEHSSTGKEFHFIGRVEGNGTTKEVKSYSFTDTKPFPGKNYYRLVQFDLDGKKEYSQIRYVNIEATDKSLQISIYPNPAKNEIKIASNHFIQKARVVFYDLLSGVIVLEKDFDSFAWEQSLDINSIKSGLYRVYISSDKGNTSEKVVVVK